MINIEQIRIGNYIFVDNIIRKIGCFKTEGTLLQKQFVGFRQENQYCYEDCNSEILQFIPLTEQLLNDFGFSYHSYFHLWQRSRPSRSYSIELDNDFAALDFMHRPIVQKLQYVHTMQNLFYFIQGIEL